MKYSDRKAIMGHIREAKREGKCIQCQHPWYDGICSCGKWGEKEASIAKLVNGLMEEKLKVEELEREVERQEEVRKIDESLLEVEDLSRLWER